MTEHLAGKTVLVTGATGFLGGALARKLAADGVQVRALARNPERAKYIRDVPNIEIALGDITQPGQISAAMQGCSVVFHVAAAVSGSLAQQMSANRDGTRSVMAAAADAGVERVVHVSTISVYGYKNMTDVTEDTPPNPGRDPYGISKLAAEQVVHEIGQAHHLAYSIVRPGMIYGPRSGMWTGQMFKVARRNPTIFIGSGSGSCYPIHIDDVVSLTILLATHPNAVGQTFNCTPDPSPTWRDFLGSYARLAGHNRWLSVPPVLLKPVATLGGLFAPPNGPIKDLPDLLPFSQRYITYKTTKARELLGWSAKIALDDGIQGCESWLREKGLLR